MEGVSPLFLAPPLLGNAHLQTIVGARLVLAREPGSRTVEVPLPDGDRLALEVTTPAGWTPPAGTAVLVHGLGGSHRSIYMVRAAATLAARGVRAVRLNMRGCGSGGGLARKPYSAGCGADVAAAIRHLQALTPGAPRPASALIGFSLGGNVVLKLAADLGEDAGDLVRQVVAICPAADLDACWSRIARRRNRLYEAMFVRWLVADVRVREAAYPDLGRRRFPRRLRLRAFDDVYTAPLWGYRDAAEYYARASAAPRIGRVAVPTRVLFAQDDPIIDGAVLDRHDRPACVEVHRVSGGGHLGFVAHPRHGGSAWLDEQLLRWLDL